MNPKARIFGNNATVYLDGEIGVEIHGGWLARDIMDLSAQGYKVTVNINSVGGSVLQGYQIIDAIIQTQANTHISGIAASMGGIIAMFGQERTANDFAILMIHAPSGGGDDLLDMITKKFKNILLDKTKFDPDMVEEMMSGKKDYFFDADEMWSMGVINSEPIRTGKERLKVEQTMNVHEAYAIVNKLNFEIKMKDVLNKLSLSATASEQDVLNKIDELMGNTDALNQSVTDKDAEIATLKGQIETLESESKNKSTQLAEQLVNKAVEDGKIDEASKSQWVEMATANYQSTEKMIAGIKVSHDQRVIETPTASSNGKAETIDEVIKSADKIREYVRNSAKLEALRQSDEAGFEKLMNAYTEIQ